MGILAIEEFENILVLKSSQSNLFKYIDILACDNPFCDCGYIELVCLSEQELNDADKEFEPAFQGEAYKKSITMFENLGAGEREKMEKLFSYLNKNLTEEDWDKILQIYRTNKSQQVEEFIAEDYSEYEYTFESKHIEDPSLTILYKTIFPACELFTVEKDGIEYELADQYCKKLECNCSKMYFTLFNGGDYVEEFEYDYRTQQVNNDECFWVIDQLIENYEELNTRLEIRNLNIRCLYGEDIVRSGELLLAERNELLKENKVLRKQNNELTKQKEDMLKQYGRNDKCPCGSGKKFKKCCLKKFKKMIE